MNSLRIRIPLIITVILVIGLGTSMALVLRQFEQGLLLEVEYQSTLLADALAANITSSNDLDVTRLQSVTDRLTQGRETSLEVNVILLDGDTSSIVASNLQDNLGATSDGEHQQLQDTLNNGVSIYEIGMDKAPAQTSDDTPTTNVGKQIPTDQRFLSLQVPLYINTNAVGSINIKLSLAELDAQIATIRNTMLLSLLIIPLGMIVVIAFLLDGMILKPLSNLLQAMQDFAKNQHDQPLPENRHDEIGQVAHNFNIMSDNIKNYQQSLTDINASLEQRVEERTAQLSELNATLEQRVEERSGEVLKMNSKLRRVHEFTRGTLEQMAESVRMGTSEAELLGYLTQVKSEFTKLD